VIIEKHLQDISELLQYDCVADGAQDESDAMRQMNQT